LFREKGRVNRRHGRDEADRPSASRAFFQSGRPSSLLRQFATTDEVATLVVFVASPLPSATHGAALWAEGSVVRSIF
ncbi:MAG: hypothetical protein ABSH34_17500, partial [Verrucomicrobiota bacterium]